MSIRTIKVEDVSMPEQTFIETFVVHMRKKPNDRQYDKFYTKVAQREFNRLYTEQTAEAFHAMMD